MPESQITETPPKNTTVTISAGQNSTIYPPHFIKTSGKDVIASGSVVLFSYDNLEIKIAQFNFIFNFIENGSEASVSFRNDGPQTLIIDLYNFSNSIGVGTTSPYQLGTLMSRELYLGFRVYAFDKESSKTVHYTFMLGDAI